MFRAVVAVGCVLLLSARAEAEVFIANDGTLFFSLSRGRPSSSVDAELKVSSQGVWSQNGIKRAHRNGKFELREVAVLDEPYELKDSLGGNWRMWIRKVAGQVVEVELVRALPRPSAVQVFRVASVTVLGASSETTLPSLTLFPDGRYRLGGNVGRFRRDESGVTLSGAPGHWGRGSYTLKGDGLIFRFRRGPLAYEVRYQKVDDPDEEASDESLAHS